VLLFLVLLAVVATVGFVGKKKGWFGGEREEEEEEEEGEGSAQARGLGDEEDEDEEDDDEDDDGEEEPEIPPPSRIARYVRVEATRPQILHLHEIEVYDGSTSRVPKDRVTATLGPQFGEAKAHGPQHLYDGVHISSKLAHTTESAEAFMQLDLGADTPISRVILYNRADCCRDRIVGAAVVLRNDAGEEVCRVALDGALARYRIDVREEGCTLMPVPDFPVARNH
jgi:hypothetical protein